MQRPLLSFCLLALLLCIAVDGQSGDEESSSSSGTSGGGGSFTTITTTVSTTSGNRTTTTTSNASDEDSDSESSSSGRGGRSRREVNVEDGEAEATSEVSGEGAVRAEASASSGPSGSSGRSSTTVNGETETLEREKERGEETKTTTSRSTDFVSPDTPPDELPICVGLAKFDCCDDRNFETFNGRAYCGCWGTGHSRLRCNFERMSTNPLVVHDIFANLAGYSCRCPDKNDEEDDDLEVIKIHAEEIRDCTTFTKRICCDNYDGSDTCRCYSDTECLYTRVSNDPVIWKHRRLPNKQCKCT